MKNLENCKIETLNRNELLNISGGVLAIGMWHWSQELIQGWSTFAAGFIGGSVQAWIDHSKAIN